MKCKTCGNELDIRVTNNEKIAICHSCKTKRKLKKKTAPSSQSAYSNIPDEAVRQKAERNVRENYAQMLNAGTNEADEETSIVPKIIIALLIFALIAGALWYFTPQIKATFFSAKASPQETVKTSDSIDVSTKQFSIAYDRHELATDIDGQPALLVYYHFTNTQRDISVSALSTVALRITQNGSPASFASMHQETPEMVNLSTPIAYKDSILVCQAFSLSASLEVVAEVSHLFASPHEILGAQSFTL